MVVTDENGCTAVGEYTVTEEGGFGATAIVTDISCNGEEDGSISLELGGTAPYTYNWSNGSTAEGITGLAPGVYGVTITDATGCVAEVEAEVSEPDALELEAMITNTGCSGEGSIILAVTGGTPGYSFVWNDGPTTQNRDGLAAGDYPRGRHR